MTIPYPDSPEIDENIAASIERMRANFNYLDGLIGSGNVQCILSQSVELSTKSGIQTIIGVGFEPKSMLAFVTYEGRHMNSWGGATVGSVSTSVDNACVFQREDYSGSGSNTYFMTLFQINSPTTFIAGKVNHFTDDGANITFTNYNSASGKVGNIMYIFFG